MNGAGVRSTEASVPLAGWAPDLIFRLRFELDGYPCDESFPFEALPICTAFGVARQGPQVSATPQLGSA